MTDEWTRKTNETFKKHWQLTTEQRASATLSRLDESLWRDRNFVREIKIKIEWQPTREAYSGVEVDTYSRDKSSAVAKFKVFDCSLAESLLTCH